MRELDMLLENRWILRHKDKELYYQIKDDSSKFKKLIEEKLGYRLIITPHLIKLEKTPGKAEAWMGIKEFDSTMEYVFLCLILMFLEDKSLEEQFVLSQITEFIQGAYPGDEKIDWTLYNHRRRLIKVLRFCTGEGLMKVDDGDEGEFAGEMTTEVLYESTGVSRYFMKNFTSNIMDYNSWKDFENDEWIDIDQDRGRIRRNRVYRRLFLGPALYSESVDDPDYTYIKTYRHMIEQDIESYLESSLHVHKTGAFLILNEDKHFQDVHPTNKNVSDIVLALCQIIVEKIKENKLQLKQNDTIIVSKVEFEKLIEECRESYLLGWSKTYREMSLSSLFNEIIDYMKDFGMLQCSEDEKEITILPLAGKLVGKYPGDFEEKIQKGES